MVFPALFCFNVGLLALFSAQGGFLIYPHLNQLDGRIWEGIPLLSYSPAHMRKLLLLHEIQ